MLQNKTPNIKKKGLTKALNEVFTALKHSVYPLKIYISPMTVMDLAKMET